MILLLDLIGKRYGVLPSKVLESGDTLDIAVVITSLEHEAWKEKKQTKGHIPTHHSQDELKQRIQSVRARHDEQKTSKQ
jgi:hypothetical protein